MGTELGWGWGSQTQRMGSGGWENRVGGDLPGEKGGRGDENLLFFNIVKNKKTKPLCSDEM